MKIGRIESNVRRKLSDVGVIISISSRKNLRGRTPLTPK